MKNLLIFPLLFVLFSGVQISPNAQLSNSIQTDNNSTESDCEKYKVGTVMVVNQSKNNIRGSIFGYTYFMDDLGNTPIEQGADFQLTPGDSAEFANRIEGNVRCDADREIQDPNAMKYMTWKPQDIQKNAVVKRCKTTRIVIK